MSRLRRYFRELAGLAVLASLILFVAMLMTAVAPDRMPQ